MPQPIQFRRSTVDGNLTPDSADGVATELLAGEPAVTISSTNTRLWIGDGTTNRLVLSTDPTNDNPRFTAAYLRLIGGALTGAVTTTQTTFAATALVTKDYVDGAVAAGNRFSGFWDVSTNTPDLTAVTPVNGEYWIVDTGGTAPAGLPGVGGQTLNPGDWVMWDANATPVPAFRRIPGGGMTQAEADARYLQLTGGTLTSGTITMPAGYVPASALQVATLGTVTAAVTNMLTTVAVDGTSIGGNGIATGTALHVIKIDGGTF